ncbi:MAG: type II toxin-antitoxin system VapC family toxin [Chloroflexota bacterium]
MAVYFVDTSALAKRYVNEPGTRWIRSWIRRETGNNIIISELAMVEMYSVIARRELQQDISPSSAIRRREAFLYHALHDYDVIQVNNKTFIQSRDLVTRHVIYGLRSLDAIQLACAITARTVIGQTLEFISADAKLLKAAATEGFTTDDPNLHP